MITEPDPPRADVPAETVEGAATTHDEPLPRLEAMLADVRDARNALEHGDRQYSRLAAENAHLQQMIESLHEQLRTVTAQLAEAEAINATRLGVASEAGAAEARAGILSMMSHELRTPLNAIGGYAELLEIGVHGAVNDAQRDDLRRIRRAQRHLVAIIGDMLNFVRLGRESIAYDIRDVSVDTVLETLRAITEPQLRARNIALHMHSPTPGLYLRGDEERVNQVLLNLGQNAVRFTSAGHVTISADADDGVIAIAVTDTGRGIAREHLASIWEPFVQLGRHLSETSLQGVGLGLPTSRALARAMGGDLRVASTVGVGSTFTLTLPRATIPS